MAQEKTRITISENPLAGGSFLNWIRLARDNKPFDPRYRIRAWYVTLMTLLWTPFRLMHRLLFSIPISMTKITENPVYIIGHYRSGTTFLLNLMTRDRQWGFISTAQAVLPELFLLGLPIRKLLRIFLSDTRPMDNVKMAPELPEEPEHAVGNQSPFCFYHGLCFPRRMMHYFSKYVLFNDAGQKEVDTWKRVYYRVLRAASFACRGRRLVLKNPPDSARIPHILEMFPSAKFIFLYRNPYVMFPSIKNFYSANIRDWQFHDISDRDLEDNIFTIYSELMERYQRDKHLIPVGNLVEVRFEDFEHRPLELLEEIYTRLGLPGFEESRQIFTDYLTGQAGYRKNRYDIGPELVREIRERWGDDISRWGYGVPD